MASRFSKGSIGRDARPRGAARGARRAYAWLLVVCAMLGVTLVAAQDRSRAVQRAGDRIRTLLRESRE